jgi:hypothetical protein
MKRLIINFGFEVSLVLLINCGKEDSGGGDIIYWTTYVVFEDDGEDLFFSNDLYDASSITLTVSDFDPFTSDQLNLEFIHGRNRFDLIGSKAYPTYIDYGNGDIDTLTSFTKENIPKTGYPSEIWVYLNEEEVVYMNLNNEMINELGLRNNPDNISWTNDPILMVLPKKPEM